MNPNSLALKMSNILENSARTMARSAFDLSIGTITSTKSREFIQPFFPQAKFVFLDGTFKTVSWDNWKDIIEWDKTDLLRYVKEYFDCDDFAYTFKYSILSKLGIPCFVVHGHIYDKSGKWKGGHFWNAMIAGNKLYFYEPIYDRFVEVIKGQKVFIKMATEDREYRPLTFEF